jgi:hypothetical protein
LCRVFRAAGKHVCWPTAAQFKRQPLAPGAGPQRRAAHQIIKGIQSSASQKTRLKAFPTGPRGTAQTGTDGSAGRSGGGAGAGIAEDTSTVPLRHYFRPNRTACRN